MVRNCKNCDKEFKVRRGREETSFWCSRNCSYKNRQISEESRLKMRLSHLGKSSKRFDKILRNGYYFVHNPKHINANKQGYVAEHRMVISNFLNRKLTSKEVVHHINEITTDNRIENLVLCESAGKHTILYHPEAQQKATRANALKPSTEKQLTALKLGRKYWPRKVV